MKRGLLGIAALFAAACAATQQGPIVTEKDAAIVADAPVVPDAAVVPDAPGPADAPPAPDAAEVPDGCTPATGGEVCNGVDDDCDRLVDEGFAVGTACTAGEGVCETIGMNVCNPEGTGVMCNAIPGKAGPVDLCANGEDDDCDGDTDEDFPDLGKLCSEGVGGCKRFGVWECNGAGDGLDCDAVPGTPGPELCDNTVDDDCDEETDEGFPAIGQPCAVGDGECRSSGVMVCDPTNRTRTICGATPGQPTAETCNGDDDDCDGMVDEENPGGGAACTTPNPGICGPGHLKCSFGQLACAPDNVPDNEMCNDLDDDCDGLVDEGFSIGQPCDDPSTPDFCANGVFECANLFSSTCVGDTAITESCNNLDDNCDGLVDENWDFLDDPNHCGSCTNVCGSLHVQTRQCTGGACNPVCDFGYQSCDGNLVNGCESLRNTNPACPTAYISESVSGDINKPHIVRTGYGEARYRVRVTEDPSWFEVDDLTAAFILTSPDGMNMDICVRCGGCNGTVKCSNTNGRTDVVYVKADETPATDDDFDAFVEVIYTGGERNACMEWRLDMDSEASFPDGADILDCD